MLLLTAVLSRHANRVPLLLSDAVNMFDVRPQLQQRFTAGAVARSRTSTCSLKWPALTISADCVRLRAIAGQLGRSGPAGGGPARRRGAVSRAHPIHAAKGLQWPIVMPINMTGAPKSETGLAHDRRSNSFSIPVLGVAPTGHEAIAARNEQELARERVRLWYVAATRARDLLVLPRHSAKLPDNSWARVVDLDLSSLIAIDPDALGAVRIGLIAAAENMQTQTLFAEEAGCIAKAERIIEWQRPSRGELEASSPSEPEPVFVDPDTAEEAIEVTIANVAGGSTRGTVLHKLMEEVLTGETTDDVPRLIGRAAELLSHLNVSPALDAKSGLVPTELAGTITKTLRIPEIAALRPRLVPEHTIYGWQMTTKGEVLVSGIADAVVVNSAGQIEVIVDWKSDVVMNVAQVACLSRAARQLSQDHWCGARTAGSHDGWKGGRTCLKRGMLFAVQI